MTYDKEDLAQESPSPPWRTSLRLNFVYDRFEVSLVSIQPATIIAVPSDPLEVNVPTAGFWYTLYDDAGNPLYRRTAHIPFIPCGAIFSDEQTYKTEKQPDDIAAILQENPAETRGQFTLIVPDIPEATQVVIFSSPASIESPEPARAISHSSLYPRLDKKEAA